MKKETFTQSFAHRDDWLHRGVLLQDMDYYHYARFMDRVEKPRSGTAKSFMQRHGMYFLFEKHYPLGKDYVQILRRQPRTVQNVGSQCQRSNVNDGEDNAVFKALFHSCAHCMGAQQCANPLMYQPLLYPRIDDIDRYNAMLQRTPGAKRLHTRFAPTWKARRYELEVLADRAAEKQDRAKRIRVIHDTTSFKAVRIPRSVAPANAVIDHVFEGKL